MKKLLSIFIVLSIIMSSLCACSPDVSQNPSGNNSGNKFTPTGESVASSIFGRSVKYDQWTPAEGVTLPIDSSEILDMIQIEKVMYLQVADGVYSFNIETGEGGKLIDTDDEMFYVSDSSIYTYNTENNTLSVYDTSGRLTEEFTLAVEEADYITGIYVTDDYYVLSGLYNAGIEYKTRLYTFAKDTNELVMTSKNLSYFIKACSYKDNELIIIGDNVYGQTIIQSYNVQIGKNKEIKTIGAYLMTDNIIDLCYSPKTDTLILYYARYTENDGKLAVIEEHSLEETDSIIHQKFSISIPYENNVFVGIHENIVSCISTVENKFRYFDFLNPPSSIIISCVGGRIPDEIIEGFEAEYGILVRTANLDHDRFALKLMAGDTDFDLFVPNLGGDTDIILAGAYYDLDEFESLKSRISSKKIVEYLSSHNNTYFGVPFSITNYYSRENWEVSYGSFDIYPSIVSEYLYYAQNFDISKGEYLDPDGEKLYKLFKFLYENPTGGENKMPFGDEITLYQPSYIMMNRASEKKDEALLFLEYAFDVLNGDVSGVINESLTYPDIEPDEDIYIGWKCMDMDYRMPIIDARHKVLRTDGSAKELKELAREAAMEVRMRLEE